MFKSPSQRLAFFHALKNKAMGDTPQKSFMAPPAHIPNPVIGQQHPLPKIPMAMPLANPHSPPGAGAPISGAMKNIADNPSAVEPQNPMNFLKLRRTLKPKF